MKREEALQWWREAKLGLFIHWGIYSIPAQGEWIMYTKRIPVGEYEKLAPQFNPADFNACLLYTSSGSAGHGDFMCFKYLLQITGKTGILIHMYAEAAVRQVRSRGMTSVPTA